MTSVQMMHAYMAAVNETTRLNEVHKHRGNEIRQLLQEHDYSSLLAEHTSLKTSVENLHRKNHALNEQVSTKQQEGAAKLASEKRALEKEVSQLKNRLDQETKQHTHAIERAKKELEVAKHKHDQEKKALDSKVDTLKTKIKAAESRASPAKSTFSPVASRKSTLPKQFTHSPIRKSTFSTTPFLQKTSVLSPSGKKPINNKPTVPSSLKNATVTTKDNKQRSLFDDSDDEQKPNESVNGGGVEPGKKRIKLRASKSAFDDDEDEDESWFKRARQPTSTTTTATALGSTISPLKKPRNEHIRNAFKV